jgi:hypothetical protein
LDVPLYLRVLWRFRFLVLLGVLAGLAFAFLSFMRVGIEDGRPTFSYRESEVWQSEALLFLTQPGFPWGRSVIEDEDEAPSGAQAARTGEAAARAKKTPPEQRFAEASRFGALAILYASLATSDPVQDAMLRDGPLRGELAAAPVLASETLAPDLRDNLRYETPLPLIRLSARSTSPEAAVALVDRAIEAFLGFLAGRQDASAIPAAERVVVDVLDRPTAATVAEPRSKVYPAVILAGSLALTLALAFLLEALMPRVRPQPVAAEERAAASVSARRTA